MKEGGNNTSGRDEYVYIKRLCRRTEQKKNILRIRITNIILPKKGIDHLHSISQRAKGHVECWVYKLLSYFYGVNYQEFIFML